MSSRLWFASTLIACAALGFASPQVRAADDAATATPAAVYSGMVPDDAFVAVVLNPRRVLASEAMAKIDINSLAGDICKQGGFSPAEIEQVAVFVGPSIALAPSRHGGPKVAIIGRFSTPRNGAALIAKWLKPQDAEEIEVAGHKCFRPAKRPGNFPATDVPNFCFLDGRTFIIASELWMPDILAAKSAKSQLISELASLDPAADAAFLFVNTDAAKEFFAKTISAKAFPGPLKPIGDLPELLQAAKFTVRTNPEISLKLTLTGKDEASAEKLAQTIKSFQPLGQAFLPALQVPPDEAMPAEQRESREYLAALATKLVDGFVPHTAGKVVTVEIGSLGTLDTLVAKLMLPAVAASRAAAKRVQRMNNLKQLGLAMQVSQVTTGHFPANAIYSKEGKPLLSWRVSILPYLDEKALYDQFHLDEPWDSEHNKPLIAKIPAVFKNLGGKPLADGLTRYVVATGNKTIFAGAKGMRIDDIRDGASNTILLLEVGEDKAVTWTKPEDLNFDPQAPMAGLGTIGDDGILVAFADGSVHAIRKDVDKDTFRWLILPNDGHAIDSSKF